jgi:fucose permease
MVASSRPDGAAGTTTVVHPLGDGLRAAGLLTFFALGMPDGLLGVAWPQVRRAHHQPASALSVLLVCGTAAFFLATSLSAPAAHRFSSRRLMIAASLCAGAGGAAVAASPDFLAVAIGVALLSGGAGLVDAILSSLASLAGAARLLGVMHSLYAVGAAGAPLVIAAWTSSSSWRYLYLAIAAAWLALTAAWWRFAVDERLPGRPTTGVNGSRAPRPRLVKVAIALATFVAASGLEIAAGAWAASYVSDGLHRPAGTASVAALAFWAALCLSRIVAVAGGIERARAWMVGGSLTAVVGAVAMWATSSVPIAILAFGLLGAGTGPLLPLLTVLTPRRVGSQAAAQVIGWQLAAASVGSAGVAGGIGLWVHRSGLGAVPPALAVIAVAAGVLVVLLDRQTA